MAPRFQLVPAAYVLLLRGRGEEAEVLLQLRGETGYRDGHWAAAAAGHVEQGESLFEAAVREAAEEIGVSVRESDLSPLCAMQRTEPGNADPVEQRVDFFLTARRWTGEPRILEPVKCRELRWCQVASPPRPMVPHEGRVLAALASGAVPPILTSGFPGRFGA